MVQDKLGQLKPAGRNVLIRTFEDDVVFKGIVHLPDTAKQKSCEGIVVSAGSWCDQVKEGDWFLFSRRQALDIEHEGVPHIIVDERGIIVVLEEDDEEGK